MRSPFLLVVTFILSAGTAHSAELKGADAVLKLLAEAAVAPPESKEANPAEELLKKMQSFAKESGKFTAEEAVIRWLALFDAYASIPNEVLYSSGSGSDRVSLNKLIEALPPGDKWPALTQAIRQRDTATSLGNGGLQLLAAVLNGDAAGRKDAVAGLHKSLRNNPKLEERERENLEMLINRLDESLASVAGTNEEKLAVFVKAMEAQEKPETSRRGYQSEHLRVPDLVKLVGADKAVPLITRALKLDVELVVIGKATRRLVARLALEQAATIKRPLWSLIQGPDDMALYEQLAKRFPKKEGDYDRTRADTVYLLHLVAANRTNDAAKFVLEGFAPSKGKHLAVFGLDLDDMQRHGLGGQVVAFLKEMLTRDASLPLWDSYLSLSAQENGAVEALAFLKSALENPKLDAASRLIVQDHYCTALLAADQVDDGIRVLRELVKSGAQSGISDGKKMSQDLKARWAQLGVQMSDEMVVQYQKRAAGQPDSGTGDHITLSLKLVTLGQLLNRNELVEEGLASARSTYAKIPRKEYSRRSGLEELSTKLVELGFVGEAEAMLVESMTDAIKENQGRNSYGGSAGVQDVLAMLARIYLKADRAEDVVKLLDQSPLWEASDLSALAATNIDETPLLLVVAEALVKTGRKEEGRKVVLRVLQEYPGMDAAYALLVTLGGDGLEARLDELARIDRFQERPLIWKAKIQLDAGKVAEAEQTVRSAIAIDPSDGEQGKGDRMRAYAVLGDILEKKNDAEQAKIMRGAVSAIRISEDSDDLWNAGLLTRAVKGYESALSHFADAYCIQSRLALRYSELGDSVKAELHYRRAFELMPDSFGRVESHCFGCEGAFSGKRAQNIADKVFTELAVKMPDRAQVFYLLGYLRQQQERLPEAAENFRKAVTLDPDYLNAWSKLQSLQEAMDFTGAQRDEIQFALLRLDPLGAHSSLQLDGVASLSRLWDALILAEASLPDREGGPLYPLPASKAELLKIPGAQDDSLTSNFFDRRANLRENFMRHPLIQGTANFLENVARRE